MKIKQFYHVVASIINRNKKHSEYYTDEVKEIDLCPDCLNLQTTQVFLFEYTTE